MPLRRFIEVRLAGKYAINLREWGAMLDRYYKLHGWDDRGWLTKSTLRKLGLGDIAEKLERAGREILE